MKLLLDTHTILWWLESPERLGKAAFELISDRQNEILISPIVPWEIALKANKHKLPLIPLIKDYGYVITQQGFIALHIDPLHAIRSGLLPFYHRDPFDRLLAVQSLELGAPLISVDSIFDRYGVERIWE